MLACKRFVTVEDPNRVVLSGLPFRPGQRVEVIMIAEEEERRPEAEERKGLPPETQARPAAEPSATKRLPRR